jgi:hypothetical protein
VLALQVKISSGSKIYQALLNALVVPNNHAQGTIKFVQCTTNACYVAIDFGTPTASSDLRITQADRLSCDLSSIPCLQECRTPDAA